MKNLICVFLIVCITSCSNSDSEYEYEEGLLFYLEEETTINPNSLKDDILYITPLDGCEYCVEQNLYNIAKNSKSNFSVLFIGEPMNQEIESIYNNVINEFNGKTFHDKKNRINYYDTGYGKPLLVHFKDGELIYGLIIQDDLIPEASNYIKDSG
jgi:hypothetical protein